MTPREKKALLDLGAALAALGEQVTLAQLRLAHLVDQGHTLSSAQVLEAAQACSAVELQFLALEEQYSALLEDAAGGGSGLPDGEELLVW